MRKTFLLAIFGLTTALFFQLKAQIPVQNIGKQYFETGEFFKWGWSISGKRDYTKAVIAYQKSADLNYPDGIAALGEMYQKGKGGLIKDEKKGFELFLKAYNFGSGLACYYLGKAYAYGCGCEVDYAKMIFYLNDGIKKGDSNSMYGMGNMLYKGWGVEQSYEQAVQYFEKAANLNNESARYYLGICYRNGYGVLKDEAKGKECLIKSSKMVYYSKKELGKDLPEIERSKKIGKKDYDSPEKYMKVTNNVISNDIEGNWIGYMTIYDWSGQYKLYEEPLKIKISTQGEIFTGGGLLKEESIKINGFKNQYGFEFSSGEFYYADHFMGQVRLKIKSGSFQTYTHGSKTVLAGSISLFSITENCPERPTLIILTKEKVNEKSAEISNPINYTATNQKNATPVFQDQKNTLINQQPTKINNQQDKSLIDQLRDNQLNSRVWPQPFENNIKIEYSLKNDGITEIRLISIEGKLIGVLSKEKRVAGLQTQQFDLSVPPGSYIIQIISNNQSASHKVIRK